MERVKAILEDYKLRTLHYYAGHAVPEETQETLRQINIVLKWIETCEVLNSVPDGFEG